MSETITGFAAWHPIKGFDENQNKGPVAFADWDVGGVVEIVDDLNDVDGSTTTNGWRAVKVEIRKLP